MILRGISPGVLVVGGHTLEGGVIVAAVVEAEVGARATVGASLQKLNLPNGPLLNLDQGLLPPHAHDQSHHLSQDRDQDPGLRCPIVRNVLVKVPKGVMLAKALAGAEAGAEARARARVLHDEDGGRAVVDFHCGGVKLESEYQTVNLSGIDSC